MTTPETSPATAKPGMPPWAKKAIGIAVMAVVLVIAYFILAAFLPRWWAQRIASLANGSFSAGIAWGLLFGLVCTLVPLIFFRAVWQVRKRKHARIMQITALALGVIFALPNLLSLTVVLGNNNAAHAGERILDVDGPGFRGASVVGASWALRCSLDLSRSATCTGSVARISTRCAVSSSSTSRRARARHRLRKSESALRPSAQADTDSDGSRRHQSGERDSPVSGKCAGENQDCAHW